MEKATVLELELGLGHRRLRLGLDQRYDERTNELCDGSVNGFRLAAALVSRRIQL